MSAIQRGIKNTFRNSIRTVGVIVILTVAFALSISMLIARDAVDHKINSVRASTGTAITVAPAGFYGFTGGGNPITASQLSKIANLSNVAKITSTLAQSLSSTETSLTPPTFTGSLGHQFQGGFSNHGNSGSTGIQRSYTPGIQVEGTNTPGTALVGGATGGGTESLTSGKSYSSTSTADVAILGKALASSNKLKVGDTFTAWNTKFTIVGIYSAGRKFANEQVLMPLATVQKLSGDVGDVTGSTVYANTLSNVTSLTKQINKILGSSATATSDSSTTATELAPLNSVKSISTYTLYGTVVGAGLILLLLMLMIVRERRREIGVLKALGASNRAVITQFIAESTTFTVLGAIVGVVMGVVLGSPITNALVSNSANTGSTVQSGFPGGGFGGHFGGFPGAGRRVGGFNAHNLSSAITQVHASAGWSTLIFALLIAVAVAVIGSSVAVATIVRIRPAEVLRSE